MVMPNNLNIQSYRFFLLWGNCALFSYKAKRIRFGKNATPAWFYSEPILLRDCLATIGVCVFRCADFGWRTFCMLTGDV